MRGKARCPSSGPTTTSEKAVAMCYGEKPKRVEWRSLPTFPASRMTDFVAGDTRLRRLGTHQFPATLGTKKSRPAYPGNYGEQGYAGEIVGEH